MAAPLIGAAAIAAAKLVARKMAKDAVKKSIKKNSKQTLMPKLAKKTATKASSRQDGDYAISGKSAKQLMPKAGKADAKYSFGRDTQISKNIKIKDTTSPSGKQFIQGGSAQVMNQNARLTKPLTKAEIKANARGLKAANKPKARKMNKKEVKKFESNIDKLVLQQKAAAKKKAK
jgi:predicted secreted Zn-dependent protease